MSARASNTDSLACMAACILLAALSTASVTETRAQDLAQSQAQPLSQSRDFGRFFTTPEQRARLDDLRNGRPEVVIKITEQDLEQDQPETTQGPALNALTVKGVVHRNGGVSTAWINDSNTYEGDLASQYITVDKNGIRENRVLLNITGSDSDIEVKVGETYDPDSNQLVDIVRDPAIKNISRVK